MFCQKGFSFLSLPLPPLLYSRTEVVEKKLGLTDRCGTSSDSPILSSVDLAVVLGFRIQKLACS